MKFHTGAIREITSGRVWDYARLRDEIAGRVRRNQANGLEPGGRVLLLAENTPEFFAELLAAWMAGAVAVPVDAGLTPFELNNLKSAAEPRLVLPTDAGSGREIARDSPPDSAPCLRLDDDALILFTSGSTGQPKGVVHTHRSLLARWHSLRQTLGTAAYRRTMCLLPVYFGHGLICNCLFPLLAGCDLYLGPAFTPQILSQLGRLIDEHRITALSSVPPLWRLALRLSRRPREGSLERVHCGSAPLSRELWRAIGEWSGTEVVNSYGITETGSWLAGSLGAGDFTDGLAGYGWGTEIRIVDENLADPPAGETGAVWIQTPALMKGYFRRDDLTRAAIRGGWFSTGDMGRLDDAGRLILNGRAVDEINKGGMKIQPQDVEAAAEGFDSLADVCAFAIADDLYGQNLALAFVLRDPAPERLRHFYQWMESRLARHKMPAAWFQLEAIPRTPRGKVQRPAVAKLCAERAPLDRAWLKS